MITRSAARACRGHESQNRAQVVNGVVGLNVVRPDELVRTIDEAGSPHEELTQKDRHRGTRQPQSPRSRQGAIDEQYASSRAKNTTSLTTRAPRLPRRRHSGTRRRPCSASVANTSTWSSASGEIVMILKGRPRRLHSDARFCRKGDRTPSVEGCTNSNRLPPGYHSCRSAPVLSVPRTARCLPLTHPWLAPT